MTRIIRETFQTFDKVVSVHQVQTGINRDKHIAARTFHGRLFAFKISRDELRMFIEQTASELAVALEAPNAQLIVRVKPENNLFVGPFACARHGVVNVSEWIVGERQLERLTPAELGEIQRPERLRTFLADAGAWLTFAMLFGLRETDSTAAWVYAPDTGQLALVTLNTAFDQEIAEARTWLELPLGMPARFLAGAEAGVRVELEQSLTAGCRRMLAKFRERRAEIMEILAESPSDAAREWTPREPEGEPALFVQDAPGREAGG